MKRISYLLIAVASVAVGQPVDPAHPGPRDYGQFSNLVFAPAVSDNLALLYEQFDTELVLCLEGERRGSDLFITDFRMPHIFVSESGRVQAESCRPGPRSVGTWHNHPRPHRSLARSSPEVTARNCYLSRTDIIDFRRRKDARVAVVSCAPRTYGYWRRDDIELLASDVAILPAPLGQLVQSEASRDGDAHTLTQARER